MLILQEQVDDGKRELERYIELNKISERQNEELRAYNATVQSQAETSLSQSHESMEQILKDKRKWELQQEQYTEFKEKIKFAQTKIQTMEKELSEAKAAQVAVEKKNTAISFEKNEMEDKVFNLENRLKQTQNRQQVINNQLDETITENQKLRGKLNNHNSSFISQGTSESLELTKANYERDEHKWGAEKLQMNSKL